MRKNAIIMAAGMSSRFAPLSYEKPKGLLVVKGEVLIERQIRQLQEAGVADITVVVGYMKEMFFYLEDKFGVRIVVNDDYYRYNNTSTLMCVLDRIGDTYICSSDNYFTRNVFLEECDYAYYSAEYADGITDEYCISTDDKDNIVGVTIGGHDSWYMIGHAYFNQAYSLLFKALLKEEYAKSIECRENLWEHLYMQHLDELRMKIKKYEAGTILEFDSLDDLRKFDSLYINNTDSTILTNITRVLQCEQSDIQDIHAIKQGLTNTSFYFYCAKDQCQYVYRHPGVGTSEYINRQSEYFSMRYAKQLGLDDTFICMDEHKGWKISHYLEGCHTLDYHNQTEVGQALRMMRRLHDAKIRSEYDFGLWQKTLDFINIIKVKGRADFEDFEELFEKMSQLRLLTNTDNIEPRLCHCDCYDPNFLIDRNGKMYLIDWEYSGNDDPGTDLGTFICCSDYTESEADEIFKQYLQHEPNDIQRRHFYAYISLAAYYWFVWAIYQTSVGNNVGEYLYLWYKMAKKYLKKAIKLY